MTRPEIDWARAKEVLDDVLAAPADERRAALERGCGDDAPLRRAVEGLLHALDDETFLAGPEFMPPEPAVEASAPSRVGPYELHEMLGEGGFGVVYRATQREPVEREVAIKLIRPGHVAAAMVRRFEAERNVLARLEHPCIARLLDAGATDDGRSYVVMELVRGPSLVAYCRDHALPVRERVALMVRTARAMHYAHQRAVIHRDLKPSNILIAEVDGRPEPRIIDFGIAKVVSEAQQVDQTRVGEVLGTPRYMSPEQVAGAVADTRADVYALGVVLCQALTGEVPRSADSMSARPLRATSAQRPSRLAEPGAPIEASALRGDLDRIVMKCVEWEPDRRYDSAAALADDLERYLHGEPVVAAGPGTIYRWRKFVGRHRLASALTGVALVSLVVGTTLALIERGRALDALVVANEAQAAATRQAERAEFVSRFLLEDTLIASDPSRAFALGEEVTIGQLFHEAERLALSRLTDDRQSTFEILARIGAGHLRLRRATDAIPTLDRAIVIGRELGPSVAPDLLEVRLTRAKALRFRDGNTDAVIAHLRELRREAIDRLGADHPVALEARLACVQHLAEPTEALAELNAMLELPYASDDLRYRLLDQRGRVLRSLARFDDEVDTHRAALALARTLYGADHSMRMSSHFQLVQALTRADRLDETVPLIEELLAQPEDVVPPSHPGRLSASSHGVRVLLELGRTDRARDMALEAERTARRASGAGAYDHAVAAQLLCRAWPEEDGAGDLMTAAAALVESRFRGGAPSAMSFVTQLCDFLLRIDEPADALDVAERALDALPTDHPERALLVERRDRARAAFDADEPG